MIDFATRAHAHNYRIDPIVRSLLDTDFYKLLMAMFIYLRYPNEVVRWKVTNRTRTVKLAEQIDINELRAQLDHVRTLRFTQSELIWLRGNAFYGKVGIFVKAFLEALANLRMPDYHLDYEVDANGVRTGQFKLTFTGPWWVVTFWEIYALTILNELRSRSAMKCMGEMDLDIMYSRAKVKLFDKLNALRELPDLNLTDFGTRRRHSFLWQEYCVKAACDVLGPERFTGTSNVYLAMKHGLEAKGTNAHELPMVLTALARQRMQDFDPDKLRQVQYDVLQQWQNTYHGNLLVFLPDTFGTTQFLDGAPQWVANWTGARPDSKEPIEGGEELLDYWNNRAGLTAEEAREKLIIFSDGLDVALPHQEPNGSDIATILNHFRGRCRIGFGWGTNLTNDFRGCHPKMGDRLKALSLVCKVEAVNGHPAVKLSDNYEKATGPSDEIEIYRNTFGTEGVKNAPVLV